jgi:FADH2 O2-dependent halogenase
VLGARLDERYDIVVTGAGFSSCILATILVRNGLRVLLVDKGAHPKFTIGESSVPETSLQLSILADRYGVPELADLASFRRMSRILTTNGVKTNFGYVYHRDGHRADPREMNQTGPLSELHLFRQDVDAHLFQLALTYGADALQDADVEEIEVCDEEVRLHVGGIAKPIRGRYLVDGSGHASIVARTFGLRENPPSLRTHSRALFTHMVGVRHYDDLIPAGSFRRGPAFKFHQGTLHHLFDGGWIWVIPMDNHPHSTNRVCSVGLNLDSRKFPDTGRPADDEFESFIARWPDVAEQFDRARTVRPWVKTGRIQYSSKSCVGPRYCLLAHSASFVDAIYSRGLVITTKTINMLARMLLDASQEDDFSPQRFKAFDDHQRTLMDETDRIAYGSYVSFRDYELWNAWNRVPTICRGAGLSGVFNRYQKFRETGDRSFLESGEHPAELGWHDPRVAEFLARACDVMEGVEAGRHSPAEATAELYALIDRVDFVTKFFPFGDSSVHFSRPSRWRGLRVLAWLALRAPPEFRRLYCDRNPWRQRNAERSWRETGPPPPLPPWREPPGH